MRRFCFGQAISIGDSWNNEKYPFYVVEYLKCEIRETGPRVEAMSTSIIHAEFLPSDTLFISNLKVHMIK